MRLTDEALKEFEALYCKKMPDAEISPEELRELATRIMRVVELVYRRIPKTKLEKFESIKNGIHSL